jgi:hypothetical protein
LGVEELGSRTLPSAVAPAPPALTAVAAAPQAPALAGTITGTYTVAPGVPDAGTPYTFQGAGAVGLLGPVTATAFLRTTGCLLRGRAGGTLTMSSALGTLALRLQGPVQGGFAQLPGHFDYTVLHGTGAYRHRTGAGTVFLKLTPVPPPTAKPGAVTGPRAGGTFTMTIRPTTPPATKTGVEGVAMVGPVFPVVRPGDPDSRPLPLALITVRPAGGGREIARVRADGAGRFRLLLKPGTYLIVPLPPTPGQFLPRGTPVTVAVPADGFVHVVVSYDSGIR